MMLKKDFWLNDTKPSNAFEEEEFNCFTVGPEILCQIMINYDFYIFLQNFLNSFSYFLK